MAGVNWESVSYVLSSEVRTRVLRALKVDKATPSRLAEQIDQPLSHVSRALRELLEKELVICLTPKRRKARLYEITENGSEVLDRIDTLKVPGDRK
jgi:DNA-binding transcriptional ArsR family regulator